jgi:hypothetical protein
MIRIMKLTALFSLLTGCGGSKPQAPPGPGTSIPLQYPVLLAGGESTTIRVVDDEVSLTTTKVSAGAVYMNLRIIDAGGKLYEVVKETQPEGRSPAWRDLGTSNYRVHLELKRLRDPSLDQAKRVVLEVIESPRSLWSLYPDGVRIATEKVRAFDTLSALIDGCRRAWEWTR